MSYQRQSPDYTWLVQAVAREFPAEWEAARKVGDSRTSDAFIRRLAWIGHQQDTRIGLNGKRGSDTLSLDALSYRNDTAPGGVEVLDVITSDHRAAWQDVTKPPAPDPAADPAVPGGVLGKFIQPTDPGNAAPAGGGGGGGGLDAQLAAAVARIAQLELRCVKLEDANVALRHDLEGVVLLDELNERLGSLVANGPTKGRTLFGIASHYHEARIPVVDARTLLIEKSEVKR